MAKNLHDDHRERVRNEFLAHGFDDSTPLHKVLEMLLFYSIPRKDTNELAHELANRFGSLEGVLEASPEELKKIKGIGDNTVAFLKFLIFITGKYRSEKQIENKRFATMAAVADYLYGKYLGCKKEMFAVTTFNGKGEILAFDVINKGDVSSVGFSVREVIEVVLKRNAVAVMLYHNHPGGQATPSNEDLLETVKIFDALAHIDVALLDHIVVTEGDYVSMRQSAKYKNIFVRKP